MKTYKPLRLFFKGEEVPIEFVPLKNGFRITGWGFTDCILNFHCPKCNAPKGYKCATPSGRTASIPHGERYQKLNKKP
jgi:hypothetical protein